MDLTFDGTFAYYGSNKNALLDEILTDVKRYVITTLGTVPFQRNMGFGFEDLENESFSQEMIVYIKYLIANSIAIYNSAVVADRQVISSQELIDFQFDNEGKLLIEIYVIPLITQQPILLTI